MLAYGAQSDVIGPEIVAPLADAVRLVDGKERYRQRPRPAGDISVETFRRDIKKFYSPAGHLFHHFAVEVVGVVRVDGGGRYSVGAQGCHLIVHQRYQRRYDDSGPVGDQCWHLIAHRLSAPGRHQHESVAAAQGGCDDFELARPETVVTVETAKKGLGADSDVGVAEIAKKRFLLHAGH